MSRQRGYVRPPSHQNSANVEEMAKIKAKGTRQDRLKQPILFVLCLITFHKRFNMTYSRAHAIKQQNVNRD